MGIGDNDLDVDALSDEVSDGDGDPDRLLEPRDIVELAVLLADGNKDGDRVSEDEGSVTVTLAETEADRAC